MVKALIVFRQFLRGKSLLQHASIYFIGTIALKGISLFSTPIFTRVLSSEDFGIIAIYNTWVAVFAVFIGLQMTGSIATANVHLPNESFNSYIRSVLGLSLLSFIVIGILAMSFQSYILQVLQLPPGVFTYLIVQSFSTATFVFFLTYAIQTKQPKLHLVYSLVSAVSLIGLSLILVLNLEDDKFMGRIQGGTIVTTIGAIYIYFRLFFKNHAAIALKYWKFALPLSLPLIIHLLSNIVIGLSDRLILNDIMGYEAAGIYSVAYVVGSLGMVVAEATNNVWSPWYLKNTKDKNHKKVSFLAKYYILAMAGVFSILMLTAPEIMLVMAPKEYLIGLNSVLIVAFSVFFQFLYRFSLAYEQYSMNLKWVSIATLTAGVINVVCNYQLIPHLGMEGAAYATLVSYLVLFGIHELVARKIIGGFNIEFHQERLGIAIVFVMFLLSIFTQDYPILRYVTLTSLLVGFGYGYKHNKSRITNLLRTNNE